MRRRRSIVRWTSRAVTTLVVGALLGFLVPTMISDLSAKPQVDAVVAESPVAREFITAFVTDDQAKLTSLGSSTDVRARATKFKSEFARVDTPIHLGSYNLGTVTLDAYAAHVLLLDGSEDLLSWRVLSAGGRATLLPPPSPIEP
jgi:hypothetical protein